MPDSGVAVVMCCAICGSGLSTTTGVDEDGVAWARATCGCGVTDILHIDKGTLDLGSLPDDLDDEYELLETDQ